MKNLIVVLIATLSLSVVSTVSAQETVVVDPEICTYVPHIRATGVQELRSQIELMTETLGLNSEPGTNEQLQMLTDLHILAEDWGNPSIEVMEQTAHLPVCTNDLQDARLKQLQLSFRLMLIRDTINMAELSFQDPTYREVKFLIRLEQRRLELREQIANNAIYALFDDEMTGGIEVGRD